MASRYVFTSSALRELFQSVELIPNLTNRAIMRYKDELEAADRALNAQRSLPPEPVAATVAPAVPTASPSTNHVKGARR